MALLIVVLIMTVVTLIPVTIFAEDLAAFPQAVHESAYLSALQAAEAGVEDYVDRLQATSSYWQYSASNPGTPANPAFSGWVQVPGRASGEYFTYAVNNSQTATTGHVWVISSGAAGPNRSVIRTIKVGLSERGLTSYLYSTQHEVISYQRTKLPTQACGETASAVNTYLQGMAQTYYGPDMQPTWEAFPNSQGTGYQWYWVPFCSFQQTTGTAPQSELLAFDTNDGLTGKVESADEFHICGTPAFPGGAYSQYDLPTSDDDANDSYGGAGAWFDMGTDPRLIGSTQSTPTSSTTWPPSGAHFSQAPHTYNSSTDTVVSSSFNYQATCNSKPTGTGSPPAPWGTASQQPGGITLQLPPNNNQLSSDTTENTAAGNPGGCKYSGPISVTFASSGTMSVALGSSSTVSYAPGGVTCSGSNIPLPPNGVLYDQSVGCSTNCGVSVSGTVAGAVTVGSDSNITIVGNLTDASMSSPTDILGLSATQDVVVEHGTDCTGKLMPSDCLPNLNLDAAIYAGDSFYVDNWTSGAKMGSLNLVGSLAQMYRGAVGTNSGGIVTTGYAKNYSYDSRLNVVQPPYFTSPVNPPWLRRSFAECTPTPPTSLSSSTC